MLKDEDEDEEECGICFNIIDKNNNDNDNRIIYTCKNNHYCCYNCYEKIDKCHMCRDVLLDLEHIIYSDVYSRIDIFINNTIRNYYENTFFNRVNISFNQYELSLLTSAKINKTYTLYNYFNNYIIDECMINIYEPSRWYTNIDYMNIKCKATQNPILLMVDCDSVLLDVEYIFSENIHEVILLSGTYKIKKIDIKKPIMLSDFTLENRYKFISKIKGNKYYCTIEDLKNIFRNNNIGGYSYLNKLEMIDLLISYNNSN